MTENNFDCAIAGEGFFKIRLENNLVGYTRNGQFKVDADGVLVTLQGYPLYESICLRESFFPQSFRVTKDHSIYITVVDENQMPAETEAGKLLTYKIPNENLEHYEGAIYIINDDTEYEEELTFDSLIINGALELSNYELLPVVLRMYYILSVLDENMIPNTGFKRELLKMQIEKMSNDNYLLDRAMLSLNRGIDNIITEEYLDNKLYYLESILPFIKWDY